MAGGVCMTIRRHGIIENENEMNDISPIVLLKLFLFGVKKKSAAKKCY